MLLRTVASACLLALVLPAAANAAYRSPQQILDASPASAWRVLDPERTLYLELDGGRVLIELAPQFAPAHVGNIRTLAHERFWDGLSIYRSQDNFVVQFGDPDGETPAKAKSLGSAKTHLPAEFERPSQGLDFQRLPDSDGWAAQVGFVDGFPVGRDSASGKTWLAHCYGTLGAGRNNDEDSSIGAELYVVTGQSPRQLDRNITVVGRVVKGMELLSVIPRGPDPMGFYEDPRSARRSAPFAWPARCPCPNARHCSCCAPTARPSAMWPKRAAIARTISTSARPGISICAMCRCRCGRRRLASSGLGIGDS